MASGETPITLYVNRQGALVRRHQGRLIVEESGTALERVRLRDLERVVLVGNVQLSGPAMTALLDAGIETVLLSAGGRYRGRLAPPEARNVFLRMEQFRRYEDMAFRLRIARSLILIKIRNARNALQRHHWNHPSPLLDRAVRSLDQFRKRPVTEETLDELRGMEGEAARIYFGALGTMVRSEFAFAGRNRRPPRDPVNALLSFGYTILQGEATGAVAAQGLDPAIGYLHDLDYGRPSLALDLLEEFRQPVVDRLALSLVNRGALQEGDFEDRQEKGVLLNDRGRPQFLHFYHRAMSEPFQDRDSGKSVTFRDLLNRQARRLRKVIEKEEDEYRPYVAR